MTKTITAAAAALLLLGAGHTAGAQTVPPANCAKIAEAAQTSADAMRRFADIQEGFASNASVHVLAATGGGLGGAISRQLPTLRPLTQALRASADATEEVAREAARCAGR